MGKTMKPHRCGLKHLLAGVIAIALLCSACAPAQSVALAETPEPTPTATTTPTATPSPTPTATSTPEPTPSPTLTEEQIMELIHLKNTIDEISMSQLSIIVYENEGNTKIVWGLIKLNGQNVEFYNACNGEYMFSVYWKPDTEFYLYEIPRYEITMTVPLLDKIRIKDAFGIEELKGKYADMGIAYKQNDFIDEIAAIPNMELGKKANYFLTFDELVSLYIYETPLDKIPGIYEYNSDYKKPDFITN